MFHDAHTKVVLVTLLAFSVERLRRSNHMQ